MMEVIAMRITLQLINLKTLQVFEKEFDTEFERDKFRRKLKYSNKIKEVHNVSSGDYS